MNTPESKIYERQSAWDDYWLAEKKSSVISTLLGTIRTQLIARSVRHFAEEYFPDAGVMIEVGCGSGQSSTLIPVKNRQLVSFDLSFPALLAARQVKVFADQVQGDIFNMPFADKSLDGLWNLGVMEHFTAEEIRVIFHELVRVLKPSAHAILFWPPQIGWYKAAAVTIEACMSFVKRKKVELYPNEISLYRSQAQLAEYIGDLPLTVERSAISFRDAFTYVVVALKKTA